MKKMKRFLVALLSCLTACACVAGLSACKEDKKESEAPAESSVESIVDSEDASSEEESEEVSSEDVSSEEEDVSSEEVSSEEEESSEEEVSSEEEDSSDEEVSIPSEGVPEHEHVWASEPVEKTEATCMAMGTELYNCTYPGCDSYQFLYTPATAHDVVDLPRVEPTCEEVGKTAGKKCSMCENILVSQSDIPALGHTEVVLEGVEATCTAAGLSAGTECSVCEKVLVAQAVIPMLPHVGGTATCYAKAVCTACNNEYGSTLAHAWEVIPAVFATCYEDGTLEMNHCLLCDTYVEVGSATAAEKAEYFTAHHVFDYATATCTKGAICTRCDEEVTEPAAHTWTKVAAYAVNEYYGYTNHKVCACGAEQDKVVVCYMHEFDKTANSYDAGYVATCISTGKTASGDCVRCGYVAAETIAMVEHGYLTGITYAVYCEEYDKCNDCGTALSAPIAHNTKYVAAVAPTCTGTGVIATTICMNEGCSVYANEAWTLPALGHAATANWISVEAKTATCAAPGHTAYTYCPNCGEKNGYQDIASPEHNWDTTSTDTYKYHPTAQAPTCTQAGWEVNKKCLDCGYAVVGAELPATGHTWTTPTCQAASMCSVCNVANTAEGSERLVCGTVKTFIPQLNPTCTQAGVKEYYVCGYAGCASTTKYVVDTVDAATNVTTYKAVTDSDLRIAATGHVWESKTGLDATCTTPGYAEYEECARCNEIRGTATEDPTGHHYHGEATCAKRVNCSDCGVEFENPAPVACPSDNDTNNDGACDICHDKKN